MLRELFLLGMFATAQACELPEHLKEKKFITIRTPDGKVGQFPPACAQHSKLLNELAYAGVSDVDIDLTSDKDTPLKQILTQRNMQIIFGLMGMYSGPYPKVDLTKPFECIPLIEAIKYLDFENESTQMGLFLNHYFPDYDPQWKKCEDDQFLNFKDTVYRYSAGRNISFDNDNSNGISIIPAPQTTLDLHNVGNFKKEAATRYKEEVNKVSIYNNGLTSITFDVRKKPFLKKITIYSRPSQPMPVLDFRNFSGQDGISIEIKDAPITSEQHQTLRKMILPQKSLYTPSALLRSFLYHSAEITTICGSLLSLTSCVIIDPFLDLVDHLRRMDVNTEKLELLLLPVLIVPGCASVISEKACSFLRSFMYKEYGAHNELIVGNKKESLYSYPYMVRNLKKKIDFMDNKS